MDTKLKNNSKKKCFVSILIFILIGIVVAGIMSSYSKIEEQVKDEEYSVLEDYALQNDLCKSSFVLYKELMDKKRGKAVNPTEIFYRNNLLNTNEDKHSQVYVNEYINNKYYNWERLLKKGLSNLDYYIKDNKEDISIIKSDKDLSTLINENIESSPETDDLSNYYEYYMTIKYNEDGAINIYNVYGGDIYKVRNNYLDNERNTYIGTNSEMAIKPKDITIVYAIPKELKYSDTFEWYGERAINNAYGDKLMIYLVTAYIVIVIIALLIPLKYEQLVFGVEKLSKIPFEILFIAITCILAFTMAGSPNLIYSSLSEGSTLSVFFIDNNIPKALCWIGNSIYWFISLGTAFLGVIVIKNILSTGVLKYIKENTLISKFIRVIKKKIKNVYSQVVSIDLRDNTNKVLIKILAINFILLAIMCSVWFLGIGIAIIYTILLFFILRKYFEDIKNKYRILLEATNKIAEGNLEVVVEENLGVFEPIKEELEKVQLGFKNAVDEEVKSQKMKTELISNVSHDLKTPLTSIITYVDLLKDENISDEERKTYIDTLDRKSQRLKNLIEDLFEVSKATSKNINLNIMDVDIVSLMKQTQFELGDKIENSSLKFKWNLPEHKVILSLDSQKTYRVFENLLINIVKYSMPSSRVYIDILEEEEFVIVTLKNMSANELDFNPNEIVERFVRGDRSRNTEGAGLGLAIAKSFVELQDGKFNIDIDGDLFKVIIKFNK